MFTKCTLLATVSLAIFSVWLVPDTSCQAIDPKDTVRHFSNALATKNLQALAPLLTNEPEYVARAAGKEALKKYPVDRIVKRTESDDSTKINPTFRVLEGDALTAHIVPTDLFFSQNRTISEVMDLRVSGDEAVARVKLGGYDTKTGDGLAPLTYDILLFREDGKWRIFKLIARRRGDERRYLYDFFAKPQVVA